MSFSFLCFRQTIYFRSTNFKLRKTDEHFSFLYKQINTINNSYMGLNVFITNVYLDCFILDACTTVPNNQQKSSGMIRFLNGKYTGQQCH